MESSTLPSGDIWTPSRSFVRPTSWAVNKHTLFEYGFNLLHQAWAIDMEIYPTMQVYSWDDDIFFDTGLAEPEGWLHVAATYDGTTMRAFLNGVEKKNKMPSDLLATTQTTVKLAWSFGFSSTRSGLMTSRSSRGGSRSSSGCGPRWLWAGRLPASSRESG